jgi:hypothetical protein
MTVFVHDDELDGITWRTYLRHVSGDTIECGERLCDGIVLALNRALSSLVRSPRLHHAKAHSGLRNLLLGRQAGTLVLRPDASALVASVEVDR